jgi:hypothetical protein
MKTSYIQHKVYLYFNGPCLLSYVDSNNNYYLAVWVEEPALYLFSKVDLKDLEVLQNDKNLICRHLFVNSSHSFLYDVESKQIVKELQTIPEEYLPVND